MDIAIEKTGSSEGGYPGVAPGDSLNYTLTYTNTGADYVCGITIQDSLPVDGNGSMLDVSSNALQAHSLREVSVVNANTGAPMTVIRDANGDALPASDGSENVTDTIPVVYTRSGNTLTWILGSTNPLNANYYGNICIPPKASQSFTVYGKVRSDIVDGTRMENAVVVGLADQEDTISTNNTDDSWVMVYQPDLVVEKNGVVNESGDETTVGMGETIDYTVEYANI